MVMRVKERRTSRHKSSQFSIETISMHTSIDEFIEIKFLQTSSLLL